MTSQMDFGGRRGAGARTEGLGVADCVCGGGGVMGTL